MGINCLKFVCLIPVFNVDDVKVYKKITKATFFLIKSVKK
jgi:hypothetical protein